MHGADEDGQALQPWRQDWHDVHPAPRADRGSVIFLRVFSTDCVYSQVRPATFHFLLEIARKPNCRVSQFWRCAQILEMHSQNCNVGTRILEVTQDACLFQNSGGWHTNSGDDTKCMFVPEFWRCDSATKSFCWGGECETCVDRVCMCCLIFWLQFFLMFQTGLHKRKKSEFHAHRV